MSLRVVEKDEGPPAKRRATPGQWLLVLGMLVLASLPFLLTALWLSWVITVLACGWSCPAGFDAALGTCECAP